MAEALGGLTGPWRFVRFGDVICFELLEDFCWISKFEMGLGACEAASVLLPMVGSFGIFFLGFLKNMVSG